MNAHSPDRTSAGADHRDPSHQIPFSPLGRTPSWTSGDVLLWIKRAMGTDPRVRNVGEARPISWPNDYLDTTDPLWTRKRDVLLSWARCRAEKESFNALCLGRGWSPATAYRLRDEAAEEIAQGINAAIDAAHREITAEDATMDAENLVAANGA